MGFSGEWSLLRADGGVFVDEKLKNVDDCLQIRPEAQVFGPECSRFTSDGHAYTPELLGFFAECQVFCAECQVFRVARLRYTPEQ